MSSTDCSASYEFAKSSGDGIACGWTAATLSTSQDAKDILQKGQRRPPFALVAGRQTAGVGRRGRQWLSPTGNIYLTIALEPDQVAADLRAVVPKLIGWAIAKYCQQKWAIRLTLKWPNDLLFAGAKIGGILCETESTGQKLGPVLVGIGFNVATAPQLSDLKTTALTAIIGEHFQTAELRVIAADMANFIYQLVAATTVFNTEFFDIMPLDFWSNGRQVLQAYSSPKAAGTLVLQEPGSAVSESTSSAYHDFKWVMQQPKALAIVADVGNSRIKVAAFLGKQRLLWSACSDDDRCVFSELAPILAQHAGRYHSIYIGSLRTALSAGFKQSCLELGLIPLTILKRPCRVDLNGYPLDEIGIDRLALVEAAVEQQPGKTTMIISCGTATTIDVVSSDRKYLGGWILAGQQTSLTALHDKTGLLPLLQPLAEADATPHLLGQNTVTAMRNAAFYSLLFTVKTLQSELASVDTIMVTGGDGQRLANDLGTVHYPGLVCEGLRILACGG